MLLLYQLPPNAQTHGKPTEIFFLRSMAKYLKTPYPQFTQSKPTIPTKQQRSASSKWWSPFSDPRKTPIYIYIYIYLTQLYNQRKKKKKRLLPILSLLKIFLLHPYKTSMTYFGLNWRKKGTMCSNLQNVLLKIPAYTGQYRPYRRVPDVSAGKEKFDQYKNWKEK